MAKLVAEFDTKEKTLAVTMDGKKVENINYVELFAGFDDKFGAHVRQIEFNDDESMTKITQLRANEEGELEKQEAYNSEEDKEKKDSKKEKKRRIAELMGYEVE